VSAPVETEEHLDPLDWIEHAGASADVSRAIGRQLRLRRRRRRQRTAILASVTAAFWWAHFCGRIPGGTLATRIDLCPLPLL